MKNIVTLGQINDALKIASVTAAQLAEMGFAALENKLICEALPPEESRRLRSAKLYPVESIAQIRVALAKRLAAPAACLHQIQEPAPVLTAPRLDDAWKVRMLDGQPLVRDKDGIGYHPALPDFDEGVKCADFFSALGIELKCGMAENEMDSDAYEAMTENGLTEDGDNYNAWTPARPEGEGWNLVAVFDTEDGPACWWMRDKPAVPFHERVENYRTRVDNAAVEVLAMNMKAKLAVQRDKGYRGWNNDCTQQHLSDLLRQCVDKGDPVDVANFCAFLLARGETIAQLAAPVAAGKREAFEAWARSYGSWEVKRDDDQALGTTGYTDLTLTVAWHAIQGRAALAATPAAALVDKSTELQGSQVDKSVILQDSAPVPVVLPEPFALYDGEKWYANEEAAICSCADMEKLQKVFIESQLLTLLAGVSAPAAQPERKYICPVRTIADLVNNLMLMDQAMPIYGAQYIERPAGQRRAIAVPPTVSIERVKDSRWIGEGETLNTAIIWTRAEQPAAPQAQADARDADDADLIEWLSGQYLAADFHWGEPKTPVLVIEIPATASVCGDFRTDVRAAIAIAAAKGKQQ